MRLGDTCRQKRPCTKRQVSLVGAISPKNDVLEKPASTKSACHRLGLYELQWVLSTRFITAVPILPTNPELFGATPTNIPPGSSASWILEMTC